MLKYIFILGKNWLLSLSEIEHFLRKKQFKGIITDYSACAAIIEFEKGKFSEKKIAELIFALGGTLKICQVVDFIQNSTFMEAFPEKIDGSEHPGLMIDGRRYIEGILSDIIYPIFGKIDKKKQGKYFIANSVYPVLFNSSYYSAVLIKHFLPFLNKNWITNLKEAGVKNATYYRYPEEGMASGNLNPIFPHHFMRYKLYKPERKEIVYSFTEEGMYIGYTLNVTNSNEMKMIDEERPYKNPKGSIPPKFAKIMINLLNLQRPYGTRRILDPFCGTGTILLFSYIQGIHVYGADKDNICTRGTKKNIRWIQKFLEKPLKINPNKDIINANISEIEEKFDGLKFDGVITEPILLPYFTELPRYNYINEIIQNSVIPSYEMAFEIFKRILKASGCRVVITAPSVQTLDGGRIRVNLNPIAEKFGFTKIYVLNKKNISEKSDTRLKLSSKGNALYDNNSKYFRREFYIFELLN
ncbi:MAG: TRM11 family SAM-dependent methyltransferase [Promethearchaeota archaeon]